MSDIWEGKDVVESVGRVGVFEAECMYAGVDKRRVGG